MAQRSKPTKNAVNCDITRTTLDLNSRMREKLESVKRMLDGASSAEALRLCIVIAETVLKTEGEGKEILIRDSKTGKIEKLTLLY